VISVTVSATASVTTTIVIPSPFLLEISGRLDNQSYVGVADNTTVPVSSVEAAVWYLEPEGMLYTEPAGPGSRVYLYLAVNQLSVLPSMQLVSKPDLDFWYREALVRCLKSDSLLLCSVYGYNTWFACQDGPIMLWPSNIRSVAFCFTAMLTVVDI
jgi:hypothetical protein